MKDEDEDCDELPPPPGHDAGSGASACASPTTQQRMLVSPRPAPRRSQIAVHNPDIQVPT